MAPEAVVINEVLHNPPGPDDRCFIELFGPSGAPLEGYALKLVRGSSGALDDVFDFNSGHSLGPNGHFVLRQNASVGVAQGATSALDERADLLNAANTLVLFRDGQQVDAIAYTADASPACPQVSQGEGVCVRAPEAIVGTPDIGLARDPAGTDTDSNVADFTLRAPTPGGPSVDF